MKHTPAIACTLTELDLRDRRAAWMKVGRYATEMNPIHGGVSFLFSPSPGVEESLATLVELERDCCAWMTIDLHPADAGLVMAVYGSGADGEAAARETFAPLADLVNVRSSVVRP